MCAFVFVNGLQPDVFLEWEAQLGMTADKIDHMRRVLNYFEAGKYYRLYAWNVVQRRYEWLDGQPKYY